MSAGTLTLTNNSALVSGTGTTFSTELSAGDFIVVTVGGVPYTLPVKSVESGTALTLVSNFTGPTQSGAAWSAVPRVALNMVTAAMVVQNTEALRGLNYDKQNWQQVFSGTGTITVKLPDQSTFTGPSWKYLADNMATKSNGAVPVNQGGTGATNSPGARTSLGLGTAATYNAGKNINNIPIVGDMWGFGVNNNTHIVINAASNNDIYSSLLGYGSCVFRNNTTPGGGVPATTFSASLWLQTGDTAGAIQIPYSPSGTVTIISAQSNVGVYSRTMYDTANTTVDGNGFIKKASPIVKLKGDRSAEVNYQAEGASTERIDLGVYRISGVLGFNSTPEWGGIDGGIEIPLDRNKLPLLWIDYKIESDGSILLKTYHRTHTSAPEFARNLIGYKPDDDTFIETIKEGEPVDIPEGRWVELRVEMPADSIFNQRQEEMRVAMEQAEQTRNENQQNT
ncbi:phage tail fiber protein [Citrobacter europaeus]|uniref:phage tail fiber protein n=1 Tax=Citrobacter europaeus TaxID=1914243 RepID=UPI0019005C70|nr:phage tail protein [Citrobacter europaeus]MBJ8823638.1 phage tail protein [Citrobacter freundii]MDT7086195.1 phage tail protein [Citrobacter europaeus]